MQEELIRQIDTLQTEVDGLVKPETNNFISDYNPIINGSPNIWQRGTSFAAIATATYSADRWRYDKVGTMVHTASRSTDVPAVANATSFSNYSILLDCTTIDAAIAAGDHTTITQRIEGYNFLIIAQRQFTLSFWVKGTKTGIYCVSFRNSGGDRSYVAEYTINTTDTWEYKTITVSASPAAGTWDYTSGIGLIVSFALAVGSTFQTTADAWNIGNFLGTSNQVNACDNTANDFRIALVKIELGSVATPFAHKQFGTEVKLCQRYYEKSFNIETDPGTATEVGISIGYLDDSTGRNTRLPVYFNTLKRATPTLLGWDAAANANTCSTWDAGNARTDNLSTASRGFQSTGEHNFSFREANLGASEIIFGTHWTAESEL